MTKMVWKRKTGALTLLLLASLPLRGGTGRPGDGLLSFVLLFGFLLLLLGILHLATYIKKVIAELQKDIF